MPGTSLRHSLIPTTKPQSVCFPSNFMMGNGGSETLSDLFEVTQPVSGKVDSKSVGCQSLDTSPHEYRRLLKMSSVWNVQDRMTSAQWVRRHDSEVPIQLICFSFLISRLVTLYNHRPPEKKDNLVIRPHLTDGGAEEQTTYPV